MSRSYKKSPINKDRNSKAEKRYASKAVRRVSDVSGGKQFKKVYCSRNICDWRFLEHSYTAEQFRKAWFDPDNKDFDRRRNRFNNWKTAYRFYIRHYKRK